MRYGFARLAGLGLLAIMLAGCTAQASDPRRHKGHHMTRLYTIDEETGEIMEAEKPNKSSQPSIEIAGSVGRTVPAGVGEFVTVLDWRSDDEGAQEMLVTVGISRPAFVAPPPNPVPFPYAPPGIAGVLVNGRTPLAVISYGIGGMTETIVIDAYPEQKISLAASFVRVQVYNATSAANEFFASVCRQRGNPHLGSRFSVHASLLVAGFVDLDVPTYARSAKITRSRSGDGLRGSMDIQWRNLTTMVDAFSVAALIDVPELILPAGASVLRIANTEAAATEQIDVVWFLEP